MFLTFGTHCERNRHSCWLIVPIPLGTLAGWSMRCYARLSSASPHKGRTVPGCGVCYNESVSGVQEASLAHDVTGPPDTRLSELTEGIRLHLDGTQITLESCQQRVSFRCIQLNAGMASCSVHRSASVPRKLQVFFPGCDRVTDGPVLKPLLFGDMLMA